MSCDKHRSCLTGIRYPSHSSNLFRVLSSVKIMQVLSGNTRGVKIDDIALFMLRQYTLDGDVKSQVKAAIRVALRLNLVLERNNRYIAVPPAASIMRMPPGPCRDRQVRRIMNVFPIACYRRPKSSKCPDTCYEDKGPCAYAPKTIACGKACGKKERFHKGGASKCARNVGRDMKFMNRSKQKSPKKTCFGQSDASKSVDMDDNANFGCYTNKFDQDDSDDDCYE